MIDKIDSLLKIIGVVHSSLKTTQDPPVQGKHKMQKATLEIFPEYYLGLTGMQDMKQLVVLYWLHKADREVLRVYPGGDRNKEMIGVFRNRSPLRPNPIGISRVELLEVGVNHLHVCGAGRNRWNTDYRFEITNIERWRVNDPPSLRQKF